MNIYKNNFDLLRLLAAIQVFYYHTIDHLNIKNNIKIFKNYPGVIIFFTISGFLIYLSIERNKNNIKQYIRNRLSRLYPALIVAVIISILTIIFSLKNDILLKKEFYIWIIGQLTIFQFYTPSLLRDYGVGAPNGSLWTIIVELQFYFFIIILFFKFNTLRKLIVLFMCSIIINVMCSFWGISLFNKLLKITLFPYLYNFLIGVICAKYYEKLKSILENKFIIWLVIYNIGIYGFKMEPSYYIDFKSLISNIILGFLVISFAYSYIETLEKFKPKIDISYGIYLYHMIYLNFFIHNFGRERTASLYLYEYISLVILSSIISYYIVEKPGLNFFKEKRIKKKGII